MKRKAGADSQAKDTSLNVAKFPFWGFEVTLKDSQNPGSKADTGILGRSVGIFLPQPARWNDALGPHQYSLAVGSPFCEKFTWIDSLWMTVLQ